MTKEEENELVRLLKKLEPGFLPYEIFVQIARLAVLPIIEFVPLRLNNTGAAEVLLLSRSEDDPIWPGELHTPGTVVRPTDTEGQIYLAFERITKYELQGTEISQPYFVGSILHKSKRGTEQAQIFWVEVIGEPKTGTFYPVNELPPNTIGSQVAFIKQATESYIRARAGRSVPAL